MEDVRKIASYICLRYEQQFGKCIDEMKLHKLLYFMQRESLIQLYEPMFPDSFEAWKYGPVMVGIRHLFSARLLTDTLSDECISKFQRVFDKVFEQYAQKDSWSLSCLTHGEYSWQKAREGVAEHDSCRKEMRIEDIAIDAKRIRERRQLLRLVK